MSDVAVEIYNSGFRAGEELERERIIKLIEDETWDVSISPFLHNRRVEREWTIHLIALIKGENK